MKKFAIAAVSMFALAGVAACGESATDQAAESQADAIEAQGEATADQLEAQAAQTPNEQQEQMLNEKADQVEDPELILGRMFKGPAGDGGAFFMHDQSMQRVAPALPSSTVVRQPNRLLSA
jgi:uncharacterized protein YaiL (DUF2058 family)